MPEYLPNVIFETSSNRIGEYEDWVSLSGFKCWMYGTGENKSAINRRGKKWKS